MNGNELLLAANPVEMVAAQKRMIAGVETKIAGALDEARSAEKMRDQMLSARLSPTQARAIHKRATERVTYLVKVKAALEAGYCMMPDMPGDVIAVRTSRTFPAPNASREREGGSWNVPEHRATPGLPVGTGKYVSPQQLVESHQRTRTSKRHDGTEYQDKYMVSRAVALRDPDGLSKHFMRPIVIERIVGAMARGIFDEIVCVGPTNTRRRSRDPIALGRVLGPRGTVSAFLIAWFVDMGEV